MKSMLVLVAHLTSAACSDVEPPSSPRNTYGAPIRDGGESATLAQVLAKPEAYAGKTVTLTGEVRQACTVKGCWMELAPTADAPGGARVTFKDCGFFVPTDSRGAHARVQGTIAVKAIEAGEVAHMESEGGTVGGKTADGTAREVRIVAAGVELWRG
jgi:hypothetical protein